jgi:competence CoiA-like predicted nuclease
MPNPAFIHTQSSRIQHFLGLVDIYLLLGKPERFLVEPDIPNHAYRPDAITQLRDQRIVIEYQRSHISHKTMQEKVNNFVDSGDIHKSKELWIITDKSFKVEYPKEYTVQQFPLTEVKEKRVL